MWAVRHPRNSLQIFMYMEKANISKISVTTLAYWSIKCHSSLDVICIIGSRCKNYCIYQGHKFSPKSGSHLQIVCSRMLTRNNFHADDPKFWSDLRSSRISGPWNSVRVYWRTDSDVRKKTLIIFMTILGFTAQGLSSGRPGAWDCYVPDIR